MEILGKSKSIISKLFFNSFGILLSLVLFSSCSDIIDGAGHMAYGFATFMFGLLKIFLIIIVAIAAIGLVISIIKAIFGG